MKDDVEKQEFAACRSCSMPEESLDLNTKQSEVFVGTLKNLNLLDQMKRDMVKKYLSLPKPEVFH